MYKKIFLIWFLLFCVSYTSTSWSAEKSVKICTLYDYPPFCFKEENATEIVHDIVPPGKDAISLKGYSWDVVRESFHAVGYTIHLIVVPWSRGMKYIENGEADLIFPATKTRDRMKKFYYPKHTTDRQQFVIYIRDGYNLKWHGLESLRGLHIGTIFKWSFGQKFEDADYFKKVQSYKIIDALRNLDKGLLDGVVGYEITYDYILRKHTFLNKFIKLPPFDHMDEFVIGSKKYPQVKKLLEEFDKGKKIIIQNGAFDKINEKW